MTTLRVLLVNCLHLQLLSGQLKPWRGQPIETFWDRLLSQSTGMCAYREVIGSACMTPGLQLVLGRSFWNM